MVRAKFYVSQITQYSHSKAVLVRLQPVYSNDPNHENKKWSDATPTGSIEMHINNPDAVAEFVLGHEYFVDFTLADS